jgi:hypothetical protein
MHRGVVREEDLQQIAEIEERQADPGNLPLFDRVINSAQQDLEETRQALTSGNAGEKSQQLVKMLKHGVESEALNSVVGSAEADIGRAIVHGAGQVAVDPQRETVSRMLSVVTANAPQLYRFLVDRVKLAFRKTEFDCGSPQLQGLSASNLLYLIIFN